MKGFDLGWVGLIAFDLICFEEDLSTQLGCIYTYVVGDMRIGAFGCYLDFSEVDTSKWGTKAVMTGIHVVFVGALFALDSDLRRETVIHPWYTALYLLLFLLSLFQYFYTAGSSPGYVLDVLNSNMVNEADIKRRFDFVSSSASSTQRSGTLAVDLPGYRSPTYGTTRVRGLPAQATETTEIIPIFSNVSRTWSCPYCHCWQPPRSKHCHDCEKCVLQFDHHCVWLGTCVGQGNHCRFWWYLFEESVLCAWTAVMYGMSIRKDVSKAWWRAGIEIILLIGLLFCLIILLMLLFFHTYLILTNQTTYELIRRRRIPYLRGIPDKVHPFSRGLLRNIYEFCCSWDSFYKIDSLPTREELEEKARPYTFWDIMSCRCCC